MIRVLFFARVREELDCAELQLPVDHCCPDMDSLVEYLCEARGPSWRAVLQQDNLIRALNQTVVDGNEPLTDGDEVAFFPPVTGG